MNYLLFFIGIFLLIKGAGWLVAGASSLADNLGVSKLTIGLTVASLGTSLPELGISLFAAARGSGEVVLGNILGSCVANLLLVLGVASLLTSLKVKFSTTWKEIPFAFLAAMVVGVFAFRPWLADVASENILGRADGIILLFFLAIFMYYVFELAKRTRENILEQLIQKRSSISIVFLIVGGAIALYFGGEWTVGGAVATARVLGISEYLITATIVAIGTSLPELSAAIVAVKKDNIDLAVGNVIGSNILNIFMVLGITSIANPLTLPSFIKVDALVLIAGTFFLFIFMFTSGKHKLDRWEGGMFLIGYAAYLAFLVIRG